MTLCNVGQRRRRWADIVVKCYTNVLCLLGRRTFSQTLYIYLMLVQCWASVADVGLTLKQHWINVSFEQYFVISSVAILMPSICTQQATVGLHLTVPGMRVLQLDDSLMYLMTCFAGNSLYYNRIRVFIIVISRDPLYTSRKALTLRDGCNAYKSFLLYILRSTLAFIICLSRFSSNVCVHYESARYKHTASSMLDQRPRRWPASIQKWAVNRNVCAR